MQQAGCEHGRHAVNRPFGAALTRACLFEARWLPTWAPCIIKFDSCGSNNDLHAEWAHTGRHLDSVTTFLSSYARPGRTTYCSYRRCHEALEYAERTGLWSERYGTGDPAGSLRSTVSTRSLDGQLQWHNGIMMPCWRRGKRESRGSFANTKRKNSNRKAAAAGAGRAMFKSVHPTAPCPRVPLCHRVKGAESPKLPDPRPALAV
jgi:hypothetical protein